MIKCRSGGSSAGSTTNTLALTLRASVFHKKKFYKNKLSLLKSFTFNSLICVGRRSRRRVLKVNFARVRIDMADKVELDAPISLQGLWDDSDDEGEDEDEEKGDNRDHEKGKPSSFDNTSEEQEVELCGAKMRVRQFCFHSHNANRVWPGTFGLASYFLDDDDGGDDDRKRVERELVGKAVLELGSATGLLSLRLSMAGVKDIVTSDVKDDGAVEENIRHNAEINSLPSPKHVAHTWGEGWPESEGGFDVVLASDILLYVSAYPDLVKTLGEIIKEGECSKAFVMCWKRRMKGSQRFFELMSEAGFDWAHEGNCIYRFWRKAV